MLPALSGNVQTAPSSALQVRRKPHIDCECTGLSSRTSLCLVTAIACSKEPADFDSPTLPVDSASQGKRARGSEARGHCRHWCRLRVRILPRHSIPAKAEATLHHSLRRGKSRSLSTQRRRQVVYALQFGCGRSRRPDLLFRQPGIHKRADGLRLHRARYGRTPRG
jgi:hypothetical protein